MTIGQRMRKRRSDLNMRLTELASKAHISKQLLYKYENDIVTNIPSDKIEVIAKVLETTPAYLMGWHDDLIVVDLNNQPDMTPEEIEEAFDMFKHFRSLPPEKQAALRVFLEVPENDS